MVDAWWTKLARRGLEDVLETACTAAGVKVRFPALGGETKTLDRYVRGSFHPAPVKVIEMGNTPRIEGSGFYKAGIFTKLGDGQDANDNLAAIVARAFPYNMDIVRDGIRVQIGKVDHTNFVEVGGWGYSPVDVNWTVWRTT